MPSSLTRVTFLLVSLACALSHAEESPPTPKQIEFFENKIRPLFATHCYECHGKEEQEAQLRLDTLQGILKGGKSGLAVKSGFPQESLLISAIEYNISDLEMPPEKKLSKQEIADLTQWVKLKMPHPDQGSVNLKAVQREKPSAEFWSFKTIKKPELPEVANTTWPLKELDYFVLSALEAKGIPPSKPADKLTLLRRATFDLTGLPPSLQEIEDFLADDSEKAFERVIERLLASPRYGERWGRHWLDVARYADSNGLDENVAHGNAWRYRDYVIKAFNQDKPYNQFLIEQLAGDLISASDDIESQHEKLIATGFLSLGPKVLAEVDEKKMEMDIVDEQVSTVANSLMGLTFGCVRCHDHKFDPLVMSDYYGLAGIFKSTKTMEHFKKIAKWHENDLSLEADLAVKKAHEEKVAQQKSKIKEFVDQANKKVKESKKENLPKNLETLYPEETKKELAKLKEELKTLEKSAPEMPSAMGVTEGEVKDVAIHIRGSHLALGKMVPRGFPQTLQTEKAEPLPKDQSGRLQFANWLVDPKHPLTSRVMVNRIWRWHFGEGIVRTPDNFGKLGERPTNQPLLDWLAVKLIEENWSIKNLHREMMLSRAYQMSSDFNKAAIAIDPENRLFWRANVKRLEVEAIRDSLLSVSGMIDLKMGGSLLHVKNREFFFNHTSKDTTSYKSNRRSIYLPIVRNNLYDLFQLYDYADASVLNGNRGSTIVAPQALFMMNSDLVNEASMKLSEALFKHSDSEARVTLLYQTAYAREPSTAEVSRALAFVNAFEKKFDSQKTKQAESNQQAWQSLCHVILAANEFIYIR